MDSVSTPAALIPAHKVLRHPLVFPPFWILGIFILFSPLRAPDAAGEWLPDKTDAEKQVVVDRIRTAEMKWARRCLVASLVVTLFGIVAGVSIWAAVRGYL